MQSRCVYLAAALTTDSICRPVAAAVVANVLAFVRLLLPLSLARLLPSPHWQVWVKNKPMNDEALLLQQVQMTTSASPNTTVWVYHCRCEPAAPPNQASMRTHTPPATSRSVYAYNWAESVRAILDDPIYSPWFIKFKPVGPWISPKCDNNYQPPLCSDYFHMQEQTPGYPTGDGDCAAPACDCGNNPCGFYLWNVSPHPRLHAALARAATLHSAAHCRSIRPQP